MHLHEVLICTSITFLIPLIFAYSVKSTNFKEDEVCCSYPYFSVFFHLFPYRDNTNIDYILGKQIFNQTLFFKENLYQYCLKLQN